MTIQPRRWCLFAIGAIFCAFVSSVARADTSAKPNPFPQGLWAADSYFSFAVQPWEREQLYNGVVGMNYYFWSNWSIGLEVKGMEGLQPIENVTSFGGDLVLRTHLLERQNWSIFAEFEPGLLESNSRIPPTGTDFNFTIETGFGITRHLWDHTDLLAGIRYLHFSIARQEGPSRNPSLNAGEAYIGLMFKL